MWVFGIFGILSPMFPLKWFPQTWLGCRLFLDWELDGKNTPGKSFVLQKGHHPQFEKSSILRNNKTYLQYQLESEQGDKKSTNV